MSSFESVNRFTRLARLFENTRKALVLNPRTRTIHSTYNPNSTLSTGKGSLLFKQCVYIQDSCRDNDLLMEFEKPQLTTKNNPKLTWLLPSLIKSAKVLFIGIIMLSSVINNFYIQFLNKILHASEHGLFNNFFRTGQFFIFYKIEFATLIK